MGFGRRFRRHWLWFVLPAVAGFLLLTLIIVLAAGSRGISESLDDPAAILEAYNPADFTGLTLLDDGTARIRLEKKDLYWFGREYGLDEPIRERLSRDKHLTDAGFRISNGRVVMSVLRRVGGLLPITCRAVISAELSDGTLTLRAEKVTLGARLTLKEEHWPAIFREELRLDLRKADFAGELLGAELVDGALQLQLDGLRGNVTGALTLDEETVSRLRLFGVPGDSMPLVTELVASDARELEASQLIAAALDSGRLEGAMAELMSLCTEKTLPLLWAGDSELSRTLLWGPLRERAAQWRESRDNYLTARQEIYEKLMFSVRELYRGGALGIQETGFYLVARDETVHPGNLSKLDVTALDSRILFLTSPEGELAADEMPAMTEVPRKMWLRMDRDLNWKLNVDMGVMVTSEGGVPLLLYRRSDGTLVFREVTNEVYVAAMVSHCAPQLNVDRLAAGREVAVTPAGENFPQTAVLWLSE